MSWMASLLTQAQQINESTIRTNVGGYKNDVPQFTAADSMMPPEFKHIDIHKGGGINPQYLKKARSF